LANPVQGEQWTLTQGVKDAQGRGGAAAEGLDSEFILLKEIDEPPGGRYGVGGRLSHPFEKEIHPGLPIPLHAHEVEQLVVLFPVLLEIQAEIERVESSILWEKKMALYADRIDPRTERVIRVYNAEIVALKKELAGLEPAP
jgi:hypothetical protein